MKTVFITGATGFVGRAILRRVLQCLGSDDRVFMLVRKPVPVDDSRVVTLSGNLEQLEDIEEYVHRSDVIVHVAAEARMCTGRNYDRINVAATEHLVAAARRGGRLQRFIYISSIAAMGRSHADPCTAPLTVDTPCFPRGAYGISKHKAETIVTGSGLPYTVFRPGFIYGPGMRDDSHLRKFAILIANGIPLHRIGFPGRISLIHVDDLAIAVARCLRGEVGENRIYLAETESLALGEALSLLGEALTGRKKFQVSLPTFGAVLGRLHGGLPETVAGLFLNYFWMDDPMFTQELLDISRQKSFHDCVHDITNDLP
jgi:UDP-glucose 4-epimerase